MASGPITSWQIDGETVETVADFLFGGSKITADGDCSHEIKRCLLIGRKVMANLFYTSLGFRLILKMGIMPNPLKALFVRTSSNKIHKAQYSRNERVPV